MGMSPTSAPRTTQSCGRPHWGQRGSSDFALPAVVQCRWDGQAPLPPPPSLSTVPPVSPHRSTSAASLTPAEDALCT
uniref:Uncharacterized protein n=1 Tax=Knipowitschia caucasica TaxID=637954 RepID=A0AAV2JJ39_KNICA